MKHKLNLFLPLICILLVLVSCSEDRLEPEPLSFLTPENVFIDQAGFESVLITLRKNLSYETTGWGHPMAGEYAASDLAVPTYAADFTRLTPSYGYRFRYLEYFDRAYEFIKNANVLISRIDDIEWEDQEVRNRLLGEALWHRAYWYYRLVHSYGNVPWIGEELSGAKLDFQTYSRKAILDQLQKDLQFAAENLAESPAILGDVPKGAADHLLAKVYLANTQFQKAIEAATEVIDGPYSLMTERFGDDADNPDYNVIWDLHRYRNINNSQNTETIYSTIDRPDAPPEAWSDGVYSSRNYAPSYWKVLDAAGNRACNWDTSSGDTLGIGNGDVRLNHYYQYRIWEDESFAWNETPDLRRADANWVEMGEVLAEITTCDPESPNFGEPLTKELYGSLADTTDTWWSWPQYITFVPTPNDRLPVGGQADWYIFRLAGTYLLRAEAYFWEGQLAEAASDINIVRERAGAPPIEAGDVTIDFILDERARELFAESPRHSEMVRISYIMAELGINGYSLDNFSKSNWYYDRVMEYNHLYQPPKLEWYGNTATLEPYHALWPIPQSVITANTLGTINQNEGYAGSGNNAPPVETIETGGY